MDYTGTFIVGWFFLNDSLRSERVHRYLEVLPLLGKLFILRMHRSRVCTGLLPFSPRTTGLPFRGLTFCACAQTQQLVPITCTHPQKSQALSPRAPVPRCRWPVAPAHTTGLLSSPLHHGFCFLCQSFSTAARLTFEAWCSLSWASAGPVLCL